MTLSLRENNFNVRMNAEVYKTKSLEDFCSLIVSCKKLFCLVTGTATLSAGLGKPATVFYGIESKESVNKYLHSNMHSFIGL